MKYLFVVTALCLVASLIYGIYEHRLVQEVEARLVEQIKATEEMKRLAEDALEKARQERVSAMVALQAISSDQQKKNQ